ncbi:hypothetical protein [Nesterenkonia cremea]|nr:hypothetical protein [Nesterenkonia cremea]
MKQFVLAIDQGTTSTRAVVFDAAARTVSSGQRGGRPRTRRAG